MLSSTQVITNFRKGKAYPYKLVIKDELISAAAEMIEILEYGKGERRADLENALSQIAVQTWNPKVSQGLVKLLLKRAEFSLAGEEKSPVEIRSDVFSLSAEYWKNIKQDGIPDYFEIKTSILDAYGIKDPWVLDNTEQWLFGDVPANQILIDFNPIDPESFLHRYNLAQVQGALMNAQYLELSVPPEQSSLRQVFQMLRFFGLMFEVKKPANKTDLMIKVDGPTSILEHQRSYGIELANFFPAVLLLKGKWKIEAELKITGRANRFLLEITPENSYKSSYKQFGVWHHDKVKALVESWNKKNKLGWEGVLSNDVMPLSGNRYLLPDMEFHSKQGKIVYLEWIRYQNDQKLLQIQKMVDEVPDHYIFALKGSYKKLKEVKDQMGDKLLIFNRELTSTGIERFFKESGYHD